MFSISIIKYFVVGLSGYLIYLALLIGMVEVVKIDPVLASALSFIANLIFTYILSRNWVFNSKHNHLTTFSKYILLMGFSLILNIAIMYISVYWLGWWYLYSQLLVIVVIPIHNYLFNYFWVFNKKNAT